MTALAGSYLAKRPNEFLEMAGQLSYEQAQLTADLTHYLWKCPQPVRVTRVLYVNPTGLATDDTNYEIIKLLNVTQSNLVVASWSTKTTGGNGALGANAFVALVLSTTDADAVFDKDEVMAIFFDAFASPTLPPGRLVVEYVLL